MIVYYGGRESAQLAGALVGAGRSTAAASSTQYWFQVSAIRAAGPSTWSNPATKRAA